MQFSFTIWARKTDGQYLLDVRLCGRGVMLGYVPETTYLNGYRLRHVIGGIGPLRWEVT